MPKKSIYGLVGKNGAGKTTLMRIVCGLAQQSEGSYTLLGKTNDNTVRSHMGMLIEKPGIYEHMTALENLRYFSLLFGLKSQDHQKILEMVGLQNAGKKKAYQFSLGMKQRLGIAISLLGNPDLLILDEPINGLDPEYLQEAKTLIAARYPDVPCEILSNQSLRLHEKINPADLNQFLVENKVRVCGLGANDGDIEKFFVEKLSGGQAV